MVGGGKGSHSPDDSSTYDTGTARWKVEVIMAPNKSSMDSNYCFNKKST